MFDPKQKDFGYSIPGTINEKLLKFACGESTDLVDNFKIYENDLLPEFYIDLYKKAQELSSDYNATEKSKSNSFEKTSQNGSIANEKKSWIDSYEPELETGNFNCSNIVPQYDNAIENKLQVNSVLNVLKKGKKKRAKFSISKYL